MVFRPSVTIYNVNNDENKQEPGGSAAWCCTVSIICGKTVHGEIMTQFLICLTHVCCCRLGFRVSHHPSHRLPVSLASVWWCIMLTGIFIKRVQSIILCAAVSASRSKNDVSFWHWNMSVIVWFIWLQLRLLSASGFLIHRRFQEKVQAKECKCVRWRRKMRKPKLRCMKSATSPSLLIQHPAFPGGLMQCVCSVCSTLSLPSATVLDLSLALIGHDSPPSPSKRPWGMAEL